ncbi:MAG: ComF family protein [Ilumatobacteraceae bacterium]
MAVGDGVVAVTEFAGVARDLVLGLKYRNRRRAVAFLADHLVAVVTSRPDVITWAPTSRRRVAHRGFDQAELLARALARRLGVPCRRLLRRRQGADRPQTGLDRHERLASPGFEGRVPAGRPRVLVVDDVVTTGATLRAAVVALRGAGAGAVQCVAVAATPPWRDHPPVGSAVAWASSIASSAPVKARS